MKSKEECKWMGKGNQNREYGDDNDEIRDVM